MENLNLVLPEIFVSLSIMFLLILGVFKNNSAKLVHNFSLVILLITAGITFNETLSIDKVGSVILGIKNREELIECLEAEKKGRLDTEQIYTLENLFN
jgi:NADH:ubiquinone oxidoreductase subunit 2 (subunit N)